ncbi:MAG: hypothetical protein R3249_08210, partial [Nitriliruptorales bacterium]|nr:hypothetical protein [Nitriliruptorales bacterium]
RHRERTGPRAGPLHVGPTFWFHGMPVPRPGMTLSTPLLVLLAVTAGTCVLALVGAVASLWGGARRLSGSVRSIRADLDPEIAAINDDLAVARGELERIQDAVDELRASRDR